MVILKLLIMIIRKFFVSPLLVLFFISSEKKLIVSDVNRWVEIELFEGARKPDLSNILSLLVQYKEFRNVFYYRLFQGSSLIAALTHIARIVYRESPRLLLRKSCTIGPGLFIQHGWSTGINADIGNNCWINQRVTIGFKDTTGRPTLGNNVRISVGATVLGNITIGDNVIVGANSLVIKNVPPNCVVGGVPAVIIKRDGIRVNEKL